MLDRSQDRARRWWGFLPLLAVLALRYPALRVERAVRRDGHDPPGRGRAWRWRWGAGTCSGSPGRRSLFLFFMLPLPPSYNQMLAGPLQDVATLGQPRAPADHRPAGDGRGERDHRRRRAARGGAGVQRPVDAAELRDADHGHGDPGATAALGAGPPAAQRHPDRAGEQHPPDHGDGAGATTTSATTRARSWPTTWRAG